MLRKLVVATGVALALTAPYAQAREEIRAVGSSTVYPFFTVVAEQFGKAGKFKTPIVESTGTGGGFKLFCSGAGDAYPDIANASRTIKDSERAFCQQNGVNDVMEIKIGFDGIALANSTKAPHYKLTKEQIFKALARKVPVDGKLANNPYKKWNEIDASLPSEGIEIYGPPPTSGTRDAFVELVMEPVCTSMTDFIKAFPNEDDRKKACGLLREDGKYIEAGENDNLIVQKLASNPHALGIFGYSFLEENGETVQGSHINDVVPSFESIADGTYSISRPLFIYVKKGNLEKVPGLKEFISEFTSDKAMGEVGYLSFKGLIPLPEADLKNVRKDVEDRKTVF